MPRLLRRDNYKSLRGGIQVETRKVVLCFPPQELTDLAGITGFTAMVRPRRRPRPPRPPRPAGNDERGDSESDPNDLSDEDDLRQGQAPARRHKRVVILLDLDCYEAQVWIKEKRPDLDNLDVPIVVTNLDRIILAVNYTARLLGVKRGSGRRHLDEMKLRYPQIIIIPTGVRFGKQDSFTPQKRSDDIFQVLLAYQRSLADPNSIIIERSSKDEVYVDVTELVRMRSKPYGPFYGRQVLRPPRRSDVEEMTHATKTHPNPTYKGKPTVVMEGRSEKISGETLNYRIMEVYQQGIEDYHADETRLAHGAVIARKLVNLIKQRTGFDASAGVAHNKLLAKLACDQNKPQGITIFTDISIPRVSKKLEFKDIPGYGGRIGEDLQTHFSQNRREVKTLHDIVTLPFDELIEGFGEVGSKDKASDAVSLLNKCRGQDDSTVTKRHFTDNIGASINFRGTHSVRTWNDFRDRVFNLSRDLSSRIEYSIERWSRSPHSLVVKATMRRRSNITPRGDDSRKRISGLVGAGVINAFIMQYIRGNDLEFAEIEDIKVTAGSFAFFHL